MDPSQIRQTPRDAATANAVPLPGLDDPAFARAFDFLGSRQVVLLGECSHGTSEFHRARAAITRHLIERHGFRIVAWEADWPDAAALNREVRGLPHPAGLGQIFQRFPTWMWRNREVGAFIDWLKAWNASQPEPARAGVYGLDIYSLGASMEAVLAYLDATDPDAARVARERYACLMPWQQSPEDYGAAVLTEGYRKCEPEVVRQSQELLARQLRQPDGEALLDAAQNARLVAAAERYYRVMYHGGAESWNLRDSHMFDTLSLLLQAKGAGAKAVVWAHNSHIGDARETTMGEVQGEHNIGQLCRQRFGEDAVALVGFGTHTGTVAAATDWHGEMEVKTVRPSRPGSLERTCHDTGISSFLLRFHAWSALDAAFSTAMLERFIGVIYRPDTELQSHYAHARPSRQFDAYAWFDETRAVTPIGDSHPASGPMDTYPFGL